MSSLDEQLKELIISIRARQDEAKAANDAFSNGWPKARARLHAAMRKAQPLLEGFFEAAYPYDENNCTVFKFQYGSQPEADEFLLKFCPDYTKRKVVVSTKPDLLPDESFFVEELTQDAIEKKIVVFVEVIGDRLTQ